MAHSEDRKTLKAFLRGGSIQSLAQLPSLVVYPIVARKLSDAQLGAWTLIGAAGFMLILTDLGLSTAIKRAAVTDDHALARRTVGLALLVNAILLPIAIFVLFQTMLNFTDAPPALRQQAHTASIIMMFGGVSGAFANAFMDFVYARGGAHYVATARIAGALMQIAFLLGGFWTIGGIVVPAIAASASNFTQLILLVRAARGFDPQIPLRPRFPTDRAEAIRAFRDGAAALGINAAVVMALRIDYRVLQWAANNHALKLGLSPSQAAEKALVIVGKYGLAGLVIDMSYSLGKQANTALMRSLGRKDERASAFRVGTIVFATLIIGGMAAVSVDGQTFLTFVLGDKARGEEVALILHILGAAAMVASTYEVAGAMVMLSSETAWACATPIVVGALVNLAISISAAPFAPMYGVWAVAGSTFAGNCVAAVLMWRRARRVLEWTWGMCGAVFAPMAAAAAVGLTVALALHGVAVLNPYTSLLVCIVVTLSAVGSTALITRTLWKTEGAS